jgi:L-amino acid N-acyltransferase YncA
MEIRRATSADWPQIWPIFRAVVAEGDSFVYRPETTEEEGRAIWMSPGHSVYVAVEDGRMVGSYWFRPNQPGLGAHVANAAYMVSPAHAGRGVGRAMGAHSLREAKAAGFTAMQFNIVVSTNAPAVALWKSLGFSVIGVSPKAFDHKALGLVDAYIMHRFLDDIVGESRNG